MTPSKTSGPRQGLHLTRRALLASSTLAVAMPAFAAASPPYRDPRLPSEARVKDLLGRMTIEEKVAQMRCMWETKVAFQDTDGEFVPAKAAETLSQGIGQIARPSDYRGYPRFVTEPFRSIRNTVDWINAVQRFLVEKTRLGIPALFHEEAAHGLLAGDATVFPSPTALASTWDPDLVEQVFTAAAREARSRGATVVLTPVIDLIRDPRWGRSEEFFGEDPYLVGQMGVAAVRGLQGRQRPLAKDRVFATLKHFVHATPLGGLNIGPADVGERMLRETYLPPFREVVRHADPAIIMPSYNEVDGVPAHANAALLQGVGRQELGFKGIYFSDYEGVGNLRDQHHVAGTREDAAIMALNAGVQADLPEGAAFAALPQLVRDGRADVALIDKAVAQILALKFEAGLFERPYLDAKAALRLSQTPEAVALARTAAAKAVILLKNDGIVPLADKPGLKLAVIGPNAIEPLYGGYAGDTSRGVGVLQGLRDLAPPGVSIEHADGVWITPPDAFGKHRSYSPSPPVPDQDNRERIAKAVETARRADVVLLVLGDVPALTREGVAWTLPGDRSTLGLWGLQDALVEAIAATGKPVVVLLLNGRPLATPQLVQKANALFEGWYLGQEGGHAFADILFGRVNPGGKLTVSIPRSIGELPVYYDRHPSADVNQYIEGPRQALFPFGHGLSYAKFDISEPRLASVSITPDQDVDLEVDVANIGDRTGDEVVQIYIRDDVSSAPRPVLELKAFQRVTLAAGEKRTLRFTLPNAALGFWSLRRTYELEPGTFTIHAGSSSIQLKSAKLTVVRAAPRPA